MIFEQKPLAAIKLFDILLKKGKQGVIITRNHPDKISCIISSKKTDMYWLSAEDFDYVIHPWDINLLNSTLRCFIEKHNQGVILLNGLEYLSTYNEINILFNFLSSINHKIVTTNCKFFVTIDPIAIGSQFLSTIKNNSEIITIPSNPFKEVLA
jgi:two-component system cell cycle response regulator